jgi:hypothetical protein
MNLTFLFFFQRTMRVAGIGRGASRRCTTTGTNAISTIIRIGAAVGRPPLTERRGVRRAGSRRRRAMAGAATRRRSSRSRDAAISGAASSMRMIGKAFVVSNVADLGCFIPDPG